MIRESWSASRFSCPVARASDARAAGVDYAGIYNWSTFLSSVGEPIDGGDASRGAMESSPIATIDRP
jgi:hypothetical protein